MTEVTVAHKALNDLIKAQTEEKMYLAITDRASHIKDAEYLRETRKHWRTSVVEGCKAEVRLRETVRPIEHGVRERYKGTLPDWLSKSREWRQIEDHLMKSKFQIKTAEACDAMGEKLTH